MHGLTGKGRRFVVSLAGTLTFLGLAACDGIFDTSRENRETARVQITGTTPVTLLLVTSEQFIEVYDPETGLGETQILEGDTIAVQQLPVDTTFSLGQFNTWLVQLINPSTTETARVRMIVRLDDEEEVYDEEVDLISPVFLQYAYQAF